MNSGRHTLAATSGLLALVVVLSILGLAIMLAAPALDALARTLQALALVLN